MTFKKDWEKTDEQHSIASDIVEKMSQLAYPHKKLISYQIISGGCANLNIKIQLEGNEQPIILRIYLRDKDAAYREQKLGTLLKETVPVPLTYYIGDYNEYRFAMTEFMPGLSLRDLLLSEIPHDVEAIMYEVGMLLAKITQHEFPQSGFFDKDLNIIERSDQYVFLNFGKECLQNQTVLTVLSSDTLSKINFYFEKYTDLFPTENDKHLVHSDFDPANILVDKIDGVWKVSGILDWEFSFSSYVLSDVSNMLRYAHQMPPIFEEAFLEGLTSNGINLPPNWQISSHVLNLLSLLSCLVRTDPKNHPNRCADIKDLINYILQQLDQLS